MNPVHNPEEKSDPDEQIKTKLSTLYCLEGPLVLRQCIPDVELLVATRKVVRQTRHLVEEAAALEEVTATAPGRRTFRSGTS